MMRDAVNLDPCAAALVALLHQDEAIATAVDLATLSPQDWDDLLSLAVEQRIAPLLYHRLKERALLPSLPEPICQRLSRRHRGNAMRNMGLLAELRRLIEALQTEDIPAIVLKGLYLAACVYESVALREMNDIDLLLPADQLARAVEIMEEMGYAAILPVNAEAQMTVRHHLPPFVKPSVAAVELHWNLTKPALAYSIDPGPLWARASSVDVAGLPMLGLAPTDLLLHLCLHTSYQHQFAFGLRPSCDIAVVIDHFGVELDWDVVAAQAEAWHWQRGVYLALRLARDLVGAAVPATVLLRLKPEGFDEALFATALTQLFTEKAFATSVPPNLAKLRASSTPQAKIQYTLGRVFLPPNQIAAAYGLSLDSRRAYLYYPKRFFDLLRRNRERTTDLLRGGDEIESLAQRKNALATWLSE